MVAVRGCKYMKGQHNLLFKLGHLKVKVNVIDHSKITDINGMAPGKLGYIVTLGMVVIL